MELCDNLAVGGTTPSVGVIAHTAAYAHEHGARVMCMIRPRGGDFCYNEDELCMMEADIDAALALGVDGIVLGCLKRRGAGFAVDTVAMERLLGAALDGACRQGADKPDVTFHMAFDELVCDEQLDAIDQLAGMGVTRILTHGGPAGSDIFGNAAHIKDLIEYAGERLAILPGGGITWENCDEVAALTGAKELHGTKIVKLQR